MTYLNKAYYSLKPYMPRDLRIFLRRTRAYYRRRAYADVWPIDPKAGATPPGWPGWPQGKRFALVLTHDVEGNKGLARVESLMNLEVKYGLRSSFNFVPEGEYCLPDALRQTLDEAGFEVGVHGLRHDGKLYASKRAFAHNALRIRDFLRLWKASGFRSPLMQHKLGWLHELGAEYDASTFDTDPFEPQPDGVGTVFPFWVRGPKGDGYVELPYTLVQDFTLFVILRERNVDIWKRKLDWLVEHGGMALLNTHPDYMSFENGKTERDEYPVSLYEEFLQYARDRYEGLFWSALPRDVNTFYRQAVPCSSRNSRKHICMLAYTHYESDNRVRRYAEALVKRGDRVDVIALAGANKQAKTETIAGVTLHRIQGRLLNERTKWDYAFRVLRFSLASSIFLARRHHRIRYDLIHVHNMPDFLAFAAWYPKWTSTKVILDIHDIMPELFASKFHTGTGDWVIALLKKIEKAAARFVDHVIVSNHLWYDKVTSRSVPKGKCSVYVNSVDMALFHRRTRTRNDGKFIILFPGSYQWHQGLDIAIEAFAGLKDKVPNAEFHLYGGGSGENDLRQLADRLGLNGSVKFCSGLPLEQIADVIANADLGVVPKRADSFGNEAYSTKIMEFMSQGIPVVVSRTKIDRFYFDDTLVRFFTSGDSEAMQKAMLEVIDHPTLRDGLVAAGYEYVERHNWESKKRDYLDLVDSLTSETFECTDGAATSTNSEGPPKRIAL